MWSLSSQGCLFSSLSSDVLEEARVVVPKLQRGVGKLEVWKQPRMRLSAETQKDKR